MSKIIAPEGMSNNQEVPLTYILGQLLLNVNSARLTDEQKYIEGVDAIRVFLAGRIKPQSKAGRKLKLIEKGYKKTLEKKEKHLKKVYEESWVKYWSSAKLSIDFEIARDIHAVLMDVIYRQGLISSEGATDSI
jgi:hypothetical protein